MKGYQAPVRASLEATVAPEQVRAVVLLTSITGHGSTPLTGASSYNAEDEYVRRERLDPARRIDDVFGVSGLLCAVTDASLHLFLTDGPLRSGGPVRRWASVPRSSVVLRHERGGMPGLRSRRIHLTFADGRYLVGSTSDTRLTRGPLNEPDAFVSALDPTPG